MKPSNYTKPMPALAGAAIAAGILTATCFSNAVNSQQSGPARVTAPAPC